MLVPTEVGRVELERHRLETAQLAYRSGRSPHWLKAKNPESLAARREAPRI